MEKTYFITNRRLVSERDPPWFGIEQNTTLPDLRVGWAELDLARHPPVLGRVFVAPGEDGAGNPVDPRLALGLSLFAEVQTRMAAGVNDTVVFIHGFDYRFDEALIGLGLLKQRLDAGMLGDANMVLFTWPSEGTLNPFSSYASDRHHAQSSGDAGGRALLQLVEFLKGKRLQGGRIHLVAHSMGVYVLRNALQGLVRLAPSLPQDLFDEVLLIAGDEDFDTLEADDKLAPLCHLSRRIHVYYNTSDVALELSMLSRGTLSRLGSRGPRNASAIPRCAVLVDASGIARWKNRDWDRHHYYLHAPEMAADMAQVLKGIAEGRITGRSVLPGGLNAFRLGSALPADRFGALDHLFTRRMWT